MTEEEARRRARELANGDPIMPGDVCRLKSGGPPMTCAEVREAGGDSDEATVTCLWTIEGGKMESAALPVHVLTKTDPST